MQRVKGSAAAAAAASLASGSTSATTTATAKSSAAPTAEAVVRVSHLVDSASFEDLDLARPSSSSAGDDDEALITDGADAESDPDAADKPWWRPWKRAPPQGRPGVAPWGDADAEADAEERSAPASLYDDDDEEVLVEEEDEQDVDAEGASSASRAQAKKASSRATSGSKAHALAQQEEDALVEDGAAEAEDVAALGEADDLAELGAEDNEDDEDEWLVGESAFAQERVVLAAAKDKVAWVVSVDCAAEADIE